MTNSNSAVKTLPNPIKLLMIDDSQADFLIIQKKIQSIFGKKCLCDWAPTYEEGLQQIQEKNHNVYLVDYYLFEDNGLDLIKKSISMGCKGPFIILTGKDPTVADHETIQFGAADYLNKEDLSPSLLHRSIRYALERKKSEEKILHDALHDSLTGLPNLSFFSKKINQAIQRHNSNPDQHFALIYLDLDRFKGVNNSLGHRLGDDLLLIISQRIQSLLSEKMTLSRFGGDEFTILMEDIISESQVKEFAEQLQFEISKPILLGSHEVFTSATMGITLSTQSYDRPEDMLRDADTAMYEAKTSGRGVKIQVFHGSMHDVAVKRFQLERDLRKAIKKKEFFLCYQPIINLTEGKIVGFEALIRWQHPSKGLISPMEFIPLAEETGLIVQMGEWVFKEACTQMQDWKNSFGEKWDLFVSVNLSGVQFNQTAMTRQFKKILRETKFDPSHLKVEITESTLMGKESRIHSILSQLKSQNIRLCIDDFGTGYSSLSMLHHFPFDTLKIDRSFINRMTLDNGDLEIVRTIIMLAHNLKMNVIAEGVETKEQLVLLKALKCEQAQGFYFAKPLIPDEVKKLIESSPTW